MRGRLYLIILRNKCLSFPFFYLKVLVASVVSETVRIKCGHSYIPALVLKPNLSVNQVEASVDSPTCLDFVVCFSVV